MSADKTPDRPAFRPLDWSRRAEAADSSAEAAALPDGDEGFRHISGPKHTPAPAHPATPGHPERREVRQSPAEAARALLEDARAEAVAIREAARREGYDAGLREGRAEMAKKAARLEALLQELANFKPVIFSDSRDEVLRLVCAMAERVLGPLTEQNSASLILIVERALAMLTERSHVTVRVHPEDVALLQEARAGLAGAVDGIRQLTLVEDAAVPKGGAMVETESTEIDARLKTQLDELVRAVFAAP